MSHSIKNNQTLPRLSAAVNRRFAGLYGLLIGDAIGVVYEFKPPSQLPARHLIDMVPPPGYPRSHTGVLPGTWSDDGSQALCLLASLLECGRFSLTDFSQRLLNWLDHGYMAVDGQVFDVGIQTEDALSRLRDGVPAAEAGGSDERDNGNGSLMRVLPLALWHTGPNDELARLAQLQSLPTHGHPRSQVVCAYYCLVARSYFEGASDPWGCAQDRLNGLYSASWPEDECRVLQREFAVLQAFLRDEKPRGTGYVLDTLLSAKAALQEPTFEDVIRTAVAFGNDTDTTAAVAGGLAGIRFGLKGIPKRWLDGLQGQEILQPLIEKFDGQLRAKVTAVHSFAGHR